MLFLEDYHNGTDFEISSYHPDSLNYMEHFHRSFELLVCLEGDAQITLNSKTYQLSSGEIMLILPYQIHAIHTKEHSLLDILIFSPEYIHDFYAKIKTCSLAKPIISVQKETIDCLYPALFKTDSLFYRKSALYHILFLYEKETTLIPASSSEQLIIQGLIYIETNFSKSITLKTLSDSLGYSSVHMSKIISEKLNSSFPKLLNRSRINHATFLLTHTLLPVSEIACQAGFQNVRTFNRSFQHILGTTPSIYRNNYFKRR